MTVERAPTQTIRLQAGHAGVGEAGSLSVPVEAGRLFSLEEEMRALGSKLMERITDPSNLNRAFRRVKSNKGAPGVDGMTVDSASIYLKTHREPFIQALKDGSYKPSPVRSVMIPKSSGGQRELGIPTVVDRIVQQAILQILTPYYEPSFSNSSYGFRPGRSAHDALRQASSYVESGKAYVVDLDLENFFNVVNQDRLMTLLARRIKDKVLLRLIRSLLVSGILQGGCVQERTMGVPQGSPLSPLLSNIILDELDRELERRGHSFCRYADDCMVFVQSQAAAERVLDSISRWIEGTLKLRVNREKSCASHVGTRKYLGYRILGGGKLTVAPSSLKSLKVKLRNATQRRSSRKMSEVIDKLNLTLRGWINYFRLASMKGHLVELESWLRHRLRAKRLHQCKRAYTLYKFLVSQGVSTRSSWRLALSGKGVWRKALSPMAHEAMNVDWFRREGVLDLQSYYASLKV